LELVGLLAWAVIRTLLPRRQSVDELAVDELAVDKQTVDQQDLTRRQVIRCSPAVSANVSDWPGAGVSCAGFPGRNCKTENLPLWVAALAHPKKRQHSNDDDNEPDDVDDVPHEFAFLVESAIRKAMVLIGTRHTIGIASMCV